MNKYSDDNNAQDVDDSSESDEEVNIHEIIRVGTFKELKLAIAKDRPRLIAKKDKVIAVLW